MSQADAAERSAKLERALALLADMGFSDAALNRDVVVQCGYDADRAVAVLCGAGDEQAEPPPQVQVGQQQQRQQQQQMAEAEQQAEAEQPPGAPRPISEDDSSIAW